ncbi:MAG: AAA-associated domain-containing protein [Ktedonobacteraceae bacterium]
MVTHNIDDAVSMADRILVLGANPGRIRVELPGLPNEHRTVQSPKHTEMVDLIYRIMTSPKEDITSLLSQSVPEAKTGPLVSHPTRAYQLLPHVAISDVTGLVELVQTRGGREDLYQLGRHLHQEVDDLLPLVEAAGILGLAETQEGDLLLTSEGQKFAEAGVLEEKKVFRDQALTHIVLLRQIVRALEGAPGHTLPEEYFLSLLDEHFDEDEAQEQLETAINWGCYAELFTFQDARGVFRLEESEPAETV